MHATKLLADDPIVSNLLMNCAMGSGSHRESGQSENGCGLGK